ncbi:twin-arginine translocase subunit TatC, partial [bacterium]|nr:twin-arginine translocase subunit TatC [bacterium]
VVSYFFWKEALFFLQKPLGLPLIMYALPEAFFTSLRLAFFMGIFLASPFIFQGLWGAFSPLFSFNSRFAIPDYLSLFSQPSPDNIGNKCRLPSCCL